jgi:hypothetical protein
MRVDHLGITVRWLYLTYRKTILEWLIHNIMTGYWWDAGAKSNLFKFIFSSVHFGFILFAFFRTLKSKINNRPNTGKLISPYRFKGRSQWPCGPRFSSAVARLLWLQVQIPPGAWMFVWCECYLKTTVTTYGYATLPKHNRISQLTTRYQSLISQGKKVGVCFTLTFCMMWSGLIPSSATEKKKLHLFLFDKILFHKFSQKNNQLHNT